MLHKTILINLLPSRARARLSVLSEGIYSLLIYSINILFTNILSIYIIYKYIIIKENNISIIYLDIC